MRIKMHTGYSDTRKRSEKNFFLGLKEPKKNRLNQFSFFTYKLILNTTNIAGSMQANMFSLW